MTESFKTSEKNVEFLGKLLENNPNMLESAFDGGWDRLGLHGTPDACLTIARLKSQPDAEAISEFFSKNFKNIYPSFDTEDGHVYDPDNGSFYVTIGENSAVKVARFKWTEESGYIDPNNPPVQNEKAIN